MSVLVYGFAASTYTRSARIALFEKQVEHQLVKVRIGTPEYEVMHPYHKMPVLEHNGFRVFEAAAILRYIDEAFEGTSLQPQDVHARALMMQWMSAFNDYVTPTALRGVLIPRFVLAPRGITTPDEQVHAAAKSAHRALLPFERVLEKQPYLAGDQLSLADIVVAPVVVVGMWLSEEDSFLGGLSHLRAWATRLSERESFVKTSPV